MNSQKTIKLKTDNSLSKPVTAQNAETKIEKKEMAKRKVTPETSENSLSSDRMISIKKEREALESFLFTESNKINKCDIDYILEKLSNLETMLQKKIFEREKVQVMYNEKCKSGANMSYANAAAKAANKASTQIIEKSKSEIVYISQSAVKPTISQMTN